MRSRGSGLRVKWRVLDDFFSRLKQAIRSLATTGRYGKPVEQCSFCVNKLTRRILVGRQNRDEGFDALPELVGHNSPRHAIPIAQSLSASGGLSPLSTSPNNRTTFISVTHYCPRPTHHHCLPVSDAAFVCVRLYRSNPRSDLVSGRLFLIIQGDTTDT